MKVIDDSENGGTEEEKKRQKRGGKGIIKTKKKEDAPKRVCVSRAPRGKKKSVTVVMGLSTFGNIELCKIKDKKELMHYFIFIKMAVAMLYIFYN